MAAVELRFRVMASDAQVVVVGGGVDGARLLASARDELDRLERRWSRFLPSSDISRLNRAAGRTVAVDPATITLVFAMQAAARRTQGRFDPTILPALVDAGYTASIDDPSRVTRLPRRRSRSGATVHDVGIDAEASLLSAPCDLTLDAGGIGKGLAADLTVARLIDAGADGALVNVGGDMAMRGRPPDDDGWIVAVEHPDRARGLVCTVAVSGGGAATSSTRSRRWSVAGVERHHVIEPTTGAPSTTDLAAVTVFAATGWLAEAHATAALVAGSDAVLGVLDAADVSGIAVTESGSVLGTADLTRAVADAAGVTS